MVNTRDGHRHILFCVFYIADMRGCVSEAQGSGPLVFRRVGLARSCYRIMVEILASRYAYQATE